MLGQIGAPEPRGRSGVLLDMAKVGLLQDNPKWLVLRVPLARLKSPARWLRKIISGNPGYHPKIERRRFMTKGIPKTKAALFSSALLLLAFLFACGTAAE